jgi:hypothetical protein
MSILDFVNAAADTAKSCGRSVVRLLNFGVWLSPLFLAPGRSSEAALRRSTMPRRWRKFCVYYTQQEGEVCHMPAFATRREAERHADEMRVRDGITNVYVKYENKPV